MLAKKENFQCTYICIANAITRIKLAWLYPSAKSDFYDICDWLVSNSMVDRSSYYYTETQDTDLLNHAPSVSWGFILKSLLFIHSALVLIRPSVGRLVEYMYVLLDFLVLSLYSSRGWRPDYSGVALEWNIGWLCEKNEYGIDSILKKIHLCGFIGNLQSIYHS